MTNVSERFDRICFARSPVLTAMAAMAVVLTVVSNSYGYHRDELYFRMLEPAWGYVDQPPLTPWLVRFFSAVVSDNAWAIRIPATAAAVLSVLVVAKLIQELGGGRLAQGGGAWAYAFASLPLAFGHLMLTASLDLLVWPATVLMIIRALLRAQPRWWLVAGVIIGLSTYNKLLIGLLVGALVAGLIIIGPRKVLWSKHVLMAAAIAVILAGPNLVYQATHQWPQITMGAALRENNAADVRSGMWLFLLLMLGPPLVAVWGTGWVALIRGVRWRPIQFLGVSFPVLLLLTFAAGSQNYYPLGLLVVLFAAGCVPVGDWLARAGNGSRIASTVLVVINAVVASVISLPVLPQRLMGDSPVPSINESAADQVGWPTYVEQIVAVYRTLNNADQLAAVLITSNYGEAGAIDRYGPALGLPTPFSGHNELYFQARPPETARIVVVVGEQIDSVRELFRSCTFEAALDNRVNVDNEEQRKPVTICREPIGTWRELWPQFRHFD